LLMTGGSIARSLARYDDQIVHRLVLFTELQSREFF